MAAEETNMEAKADDANVGDDQEEYPRLEFAVQEIIDTITAVDLFEGFFNVGTGEGVAKIIAFIKSIQDRKLLLLIFKMCLAIFETPRSWCFRGQLSANKKGSITDKRMDPRLYGLLPNYTKDEMEELFKRFGLKFRPLSKGWSLEARSLNISSINRIALLFCARSNDPLAQAWRLKHSGSPLSSTCKGNKILDDKDKEKDANRIFEEQINRFITEQAYYSMYEKDLVEIFKDL